MAFSSSSFFWYSGKSTGKLSGSLSAFRNFYCAYKLLTFLLQILKPPNLSMSSFILLISPNPKNPVPIIKFLELMPSHSLEWSKPKGVSLNSPRSKQFPASVLQVQSHTLTQNNPQTFLKKINKSIPWEINLSLFNLSFLFSLKLSVMKLVTKLFTNSIKSVYKSLKKTMTMTLGYHWLLDKSNSLTPQIH